MKLASVSKGKSRVVTIKTPTGSARGKTTLSRSRCLCRLTGLNLLYTEEEGRRDIITSPAKTGNKRM